uniref:Uncharacterized protein n=1 Tax=Chenopodium quinoa TaxID=63459 RepID=A0A803LPF9_CHEQI
MEYSFSQGCQGYPYYPPPSPPTDYYPPLSHDIPIDYYPSESPNYYYNDPYTGNSFNTGGNCYTGHGIQRNGDVILEAGSNHGSQTARHKRRNPKFVGGCHGNQGGHQVSGNVILGNM